MNNEAPRNKEIKMREIRDPHMFDRAAKGIDLTKIDSPKKQTKSEIHDPKMIDRAIQKYKKGEKMKPPVEFGATELVAYHELMEAVSTQLSRVNKELDREKKIAAEMRKAGSVISREGAEQIYRLESTFNRLLKIYQETLSPARKDAALAFLNKQEMLVEKPGDLESLMADPSIEEIDAELLVEVPASNESRMQETQLLIRETEIEEEIEDIIDDLNDITPLSAVMTEEGERMDDKRREIMASRLNDLYSDLRGIRDQLRDIKLNIGMAKRMEGQDMRIAA